MGKKRHIKKGDNVYVLSGEERGQGGKVIEVFPKTERVVVEGLNMIKKHVRKNQEETTQIDIQTISRAHKSQTNLHARLV